MSFKIPDTPEELFRQGSLSFSKINRWIPLVFVIFAILFIVMTAFYSVEQDEVGVIRRFGKYNRTEDPGLHWKIPFNIEKLDKVKIKRIFKEEFGFRTLQPGVKTQYSNKSFNDESIMLTGDLNIIDVSWIVQFRIKDPVALLFNVRNPRETVRDMAEASMRAVIGNRAVTDALTTKKNEINLAAKLKLQEVLDKFQSGITIVELELQEVLPPQPVASSFNEVNEAEQEKEKVIYQALKDYERVIPEARGKANKTIKQAEGYAKERVTRAEGDAEKFVTVWKAYKEAKNVTQRRLYLETLSDVIPRAGKIYVFDSDANTVLPFMNITQGASVK